MQKRSNLSFVSVNVMILKPLKEKLCELKFVVPLLKKAICELVTKLVFHNYKLMNLIQQIDLKTLIEKSRFYILIFFPYFCKKFFSNKFGFF